jgi:Holliday junction resolvase RusA-like endonuclease
MYKINTKPLSVNQCWEGKRFKTLEYKKYERDLLLMLPKKTFKFDKFSIEIEFGFSSPLADIDNPLKPFLDILQKKYDINDRYIFTLKVSKKIVAKENEYIKFKISEYETK